MGNPRSMTTTHVPYDTATMTMMMPHCSRAAIGPVRPLRSSETAITIKPRSRPRSAHHQLPRRRGEKRVRTVTTRISATGSWRHYQLPQSKPCLRRLFQRLKRGQFSVQDELDLHGATVVQAETLLRQFLLPEAHTYEYGCVRIIHGKGLQSNGGTPVLKNLVNQLLRLRKDVLAFHSSPPAQGRHRRSIGAINAPLNQFDMERQPSAYSNLTELTTSLSLVTRTPEQYPPRSAATTPNSSTTHIATEDRSGCTQDLTL